MNALCLATMMLSLSGAPQETVWYVPGWHRCGRGEDVAFRFVESAFPGAMVSVYDWDGNGSWRKSLANADMEAMALAAKLEAMSENERRNLTLVGHSLGARIVVRALARLAKKDMKIKSAAILAAALPYDDGDMVFFAKALDNDAIIICNPRDTMLKWGYRPFGGEGSAALGAVGPAAPIDNIRCVFVPKSTVQETPLDAAWASIGWFRTVAAHYAPFYIEHLKKITEEHL